VSDGHYEVLGPAPDAQRPRRRLSWLRNHRLLVLLVAILAVVIGREIVSRDSDGPGTQAGPLTAVIRGVSWDPPSAFPRLVEVELTNIGGSAVAATRLQMHGDGMGPGDVEQFNRELDQGDRALVKFGVGDPYCVTVAVARLDGVVFDGAGVASTVELTVADPDGLLERVNNLACFGGAQQVTAEIDADALLARPVPRQAADLRIPVTVSNGGTLPILVTDLIVNDHGSSQVATEIRANQSADVQATLTTLCTPTERIETLALLGEDFGGRFIQSELSIDDRVQAYLDDAVDRCPNPPVGVSPTKR